MVLDKETLLNKINYNHVLALIPARGGSKGVPQKNIRKIKGYPLIAYTIAAARMSQRINRVIVSTDSEEIAEIAKYYGAEVPFLRPSELATDLSGDIGFVNYAIEYMNENESFISEYLVHLRPTTPFREVSIMDDAINQCINDEECGSLRSAHIAPESPFKWFVQDKNGYYKSIRSDVSNEDANGARQYFENVYIPDGYVDVLKSSFIIKNNILHGEKMRAFVSPCCTEIDTIEDLDYVKYQIENEGSEIYDYLKMSYK